MQVEGGISKDLLCIGFNETQERLCIGTTTGFEVWGIAQDAKPEQLFFHDFQKGIGIIALLRNSNIVALVGGGVNPQWAPNKLIIWDAAKSLILQTFTFLSAIKKVLFTQNSLIAVLDNTIFVLGDNSRTLSRIESFRINGIATVASNSPRLRLAYPGDAVGSVCVKLGTDKMPMEISAFDEEIACLALSDDGLYLATCSVSGRTVKMWDASSGSLLYEFYRGRNDAKVCHLSFSLCKTEDNFPRYLACHGDTGTTHVFYIGAAATSVTGWLTSTLWSNTQCRTTAPRAASSFGTLGDSDHCYIISEDGYFWCFDMLPAGGDGLVTKKFRLLSESNRDEAKDESEQEDQQYQQDEDDGDGDTDSIKGLDSDEDSAGSIGTFEQDDEDSGSGISDLSD
eukprot:TRINITY_DN638_c0_g1_i3.p1 TRINITY_DN638_c0_g1~~TRINITY_DN638_c0_g1_i3.p1  ORF type:complete len:397 (-),score=50.79 TRINITY_DN638_c0_g1_i3:369-1559(-)